MRRRSGLTLIEVMVALALSGIVLLGAHAMLQVAADQAAGIVAAAAAVDRDANAERVLRSLVERIEIGTVPGTSFGGDSTAVTFSSWCEVPAGWLERCTVSLGFERDSAQNSLVARLSTGGAYRLRAGFQRGALRYLNSPNSGGTWIRSWGLGTTAPLAIGVIVAGDTLILRIGERG